MPAGDRKPRIAVLGTRGFPGVQGGVERHCENLYTRLAQRGCRVRVYTRSTYGDPAHTWYEGVERYPLWAPRVKSLEAIVHTFLGLLHLAVRKREFDVVHVHAIGPSLLAPLARLFGMRVIVTNHGPDYERQKWGVTAKSVLRLGERWGTMYAHEVIAVAKHIQAYLEREYRRTVHYVPNGIPALRKQPPGRLLKGFTLEASRYVLAVGRFVPEKGFHDLVRAFSGVDPAWKLVLTGDADHQDEYSMKLAKQAQEDPRIVLTGTLGGRDLEEIYSNAGVFVLPSYHEGLPLTLLEALSYGLPVLVSDIPANREVIEHPARLFAPGDVGRLRSLLASDMRAITEDRRPEDMGNVDLVEYDWERIADRTLNIYERMLA